MRRLAIVILAFLLVCACTDSRRERMHALLHSTNAANKADSVFTTDTAFLPVVDYFDRHGTANERMLAHYLLGRIYSDMGEAPAALQAFHDAIDCADTTATDCDYMTLNRVYSQMAYLFQEQKAYQLSLNSLSVAGKYAYLAKDTLAAIMFYSLRANVYSDMNLRDSVIMIDTISSRLFQERGEMAASARSLPTAINFLIDKGEFAEAKKYLLYFDKYSALIDSVGTPFDGFSDYYYLKGKYYLQIDQRDSAALCYRKATLLTRNITDSLNLAESLLALCEREGAKDSVIKYSRLLLSLKDTATIRLSTSEMQRMESLFNYNRQEQKANRMQHEKEMTTQWLLFSVSFFIFLFVLMSFFFYYKQKVNKERLARVRQKYVSDMTSLSRAKEELARLMLVRDEAARSLVEEKEQMVEILSRRVASYETEKSFHDQFDRHLLASPIVGKFHEYAQHPSSGSPSKSDWEELERLVSVEMPQFRAVFMSESKVTCVDYRIALLVRLNFAPKEIAILMDMSQQNVSNARRRMLRKVFRVNGGAKDFDGYILSIT